MKESYFVLLLIGVLLVAIAVIVSIVIFKNKKRNEKYLGILDRFEEEKNSMISASFLVELKKVEGLINNEHLKKKYDLWNEKTALIKETEIKCLSDKILSLDNLIADKKFKECNNLIFDIDKYIYLVKAEVENIFDEVKSVTTSEQRNRDAAIKLKKEYREILAKYKADSNSYKTINNKIDLQLETIDGLFGVLEDTLENNDFEESPKILKALDDLIHNLHAIVSEAPTIILLTQTLLPKKISDATYVYKKMVKDGFYLKQLKFEYNTEESNKKIAQVMDKLNMLNVEDSIFELKIIMDYYDGLFEDFNKEKKSKKIYSSLLTGLMERIDNDLKIIKNIYIETDNLKETYVFDKDDNVDVDVLGKELLTIKDEYKLVSNRSNLSLSPYSKLASELNNLNNRINICEDNINLTYVKLNGLKEDDNRARQQLIEAKKLLKKASKKIVSYNLPLIPKQFYVEYDEATESIKKLAKELEVLPLNMKIINNHVDNTRDLVLKCYNTASDIIKCASLAEMAVVYGNRYRSSYKEVDRGLTICENAFYSGEYRKALEISLSALNLVEPGVHKKLLEKYNS